MSIALQDSAGILTSKVVKIVQTNYQGSKRFFQSFFNPEYSPTNSVSIVVERNNEPIAVDVKKYTDGNRNTWEKGEQKMFVPPEYFEKFSVNDDELYDVVIQDLASGGTTFFPQLANITAKKTQQLIKKIDDAKELMCAQALEFGVISLKNNTDIDFGRKAASLVDLGAGNYWNNNSIDPYLELEAGAQFLRKVGKSNGSIVNCIMGSKAWSEFRNNDFVTKRADIRNFHLDTVRLEQRNSVGATPANQVIAGAYTVNIWLYEEWYNHPTTGILTPFMNQRKFIMLPEVTDFSMVSTAVRQLITSNGTIPQTGEYLVRDFMDDKLTAHEMHVKSRPIAILNQVDQVYTSTVASA